MSEQGEAWPKGPAGPAEQPVVLEADIEAAEAQAAEIRVQSMWPGGLLSAGVFAAGVFACGSARAVLVAAVVAAAGGVLAAGTGWLIGGWTVALIRRRRGVWAAYGRGAGFWCRTYAQRMLAKLRYYFRRPSPEDVPPGMTLEEYGRARSTAKMLELWSLLPVGGVLAWGFVVFGAVLKAAAPNEGGEVALVIGVFYSAMAAGLWGWLVRWRSERDTVAGWAGAMTMDEFMRTRGWESHWWSGWRRRRDPRASPHGG